MKLFIFIILLGISLSSCQSNSHSHQNNTQSTENSSVLGKDLVCDMEVTDSTYTTVYEGKTYYFCAEHCKEEFLKEPQKYLSKK